MKSATIPRNSSSIGVSDVPPDSNPNHVSGSMGLLGQARHPDVVAAIDTIIEAGVRNKVPVGLGVGAGYEDITRWLAKGAQWVAAAADYIFITQAVDDLFTRLRAKSSSTASR